MTTLPRELLAVVLARPADDAPRLICADWCEEHGEGECAEFIRVQVEGARLERFIEEWAGVPGRQEDGGRAGAALSEAQNLRRRERELLESACLVTNERPAARFLPSDWPSLDLVQAYAFRRGFVAMIACTWQVWVTRHAALTAAAPLERVRLTTRPELGGDSDGVCHLLLSPAWPRIALELPPRGEDMTEINDLLRQIRDTVPDSLLTHAERVRRFRERALWPWDRPAAQDTPPADDFVTATMPEAS